MDINQLINENQCVFSALACIFLTVAYVASLYVWRTQHNRDHPSTIKRRFFGVSCVMIIAPFFTQLFLKEHSVQNVDIYVQLGLRLPGLISASVLPLLLTAILFLGPLTMQFLSGTWRIYLEPVYWWSSWQDLVWVRNHVMAPLSEEWVWRACMTPLLLQCLEPMTAVFVGPLLFGIAHLHHMHELMKGGWQFKDALMISTFQLMFTSIFGAYSAFLFLRTGGFCFFLILLLAVGRGSWMSVCSAKSIPRKDSVSKMIPSWPILYRTFCASVISGHFVAPLIAHMFCNHMGFPNFSEVGKYPLLQRIIIICNFILGLTLWCYLLFPLTSPDIYDNRLYSVT